MVIDGGEESNKVKNSQCNEDKFNDIFKYGCINMTTKKSICFIMPGLSHGAVGGYKIAYEYANRLSALGYKVSVFYPLFMTKRMKFSLLVRIKKQLAYLPLKILKLYRQRWFPLKNVKEEFSFSYSKKIFKKYDVLVATFIDSAFALHDLNLNKSKSCIYLIQDFEKWPPFSETQVFESYGFPMKKIVITPWLLEKVRSAGEDATLIYNGLDFSYFTLSKKIEERNPYEISLMYHIRPEKRFEDSVKALEIVHDKFPQIHVSVFGIFNNPANFPKWFTYYKSPSKELHNKIYNDSSIYIAASSTEGFGLTVAEAMICGCAVACTDNGGFSSMVTDEKTGFLSPVFDYKALAENIIKLISYNELRIRLAKNGNENIKKFNWESAVEKFQKVIEEC